MRREMKKEKDSSEAPKQFNAPVDLGSIRRRAFWRRLTRKEEARPGTTVLEPGQPFPCNGTASLLQRTRWKQRMRWHPSVPRGLANHKVSFSTGGSHAADPKDPTPDRFLRLLRGGLSAGLCVGARLWRPPGGPPRILSVGRGLPRGTVRPAPSAGSSRPG